MHRTPDEIKKGLECCAEDGCKECPYEDDCYMVDGFSALAADALAYIQQLEAQNTELLEKVGQLEAKNKRLDEMTDSRFYGRGNY